jgi:hypothetical protein
MVFDIYVGVDSSRDSDVSVQYVLVETAAKGETTLRRIEHGRSAVNRKIIEIR